MNETLSFFWEFCRDPAGVASVLPTTGWAAQKITGTVPEEKWKQDLLISEYGPGSGVVTGKILERMSPGSHLVVIEIREEFARNLRQKFLHDKRVDVVCGSAEDADRILRPYGRADLNFSMIPLSNMQEEQRRNILQVKMETLKPGGSSIVSLFRRSTEDYLREVFPTVHFRGRALLNILPLRIYEASTQPDTKVLTSATVRDRAGMQEATADLDRAT